MLAHYRIIRGKHSPDNLLPQGIRQDTRKHTRHCLRPSAKMVTAYLASPTESAWQRFKKQYLAMIKERFREDRKPFDELAAIAKKTNVHIGCSCPTTKNPRVDHCHTYPTPQFMKEKYPKLEVKFPK